MIIGVVGVGVIGRALFNASKIAGYETHGFDSHMPEFGVLDERVTNCDVVFVSVPTATAHGVQDKNPLRDVALRLMHLRYQGVVCVRCTVLPGTCAALARDFNMRVVHMPEFLTEANAERDFLTQKAIFLSGDIADRAVVLEAMFGMLTQPEKGWTVKQSNDTRVTELQKYFANCHKAIKVAMCNEIYDACVAQKINYEEVRDFAVEVDGVGRGHTAVPGIDNKRGYSGMCFPKDMAAFSGWLFEVGADNRVFSAAIRSNEEVRAHNEFCKEM